MRKSYHRTWSGHCYVTLCDVHSIILIKVFNCNTHKTVFFTNWNYFKLFFTVSNFREQEHGPFAFKFIKINFQMQQFLFCLHCRNVCIVVERRDYYCERKKFWVNKKALYIVEKIEEKLLQLVWPLMLSW